MWSATSRLAYVDGRPSWRSSIRHAELLQRSLDLARKIAANPPLAAAAIKDGLRIAVDPEWESLGEWVSANLNALFQTEDHREGVASFLEKREPIFHGR